MSDDLKKRGNAALSSGNADEAIKLYTQGIDIDPTNHILFSNRSAAYAKKEQFMEALKDAEKVIELKPDWPKGYSRKGSALEFMNKIDEAMETYELGLKIDPENQQLKKSFADCSKNLQKGGMSNPFGNFADMKAKLQANPKTRDYFNDPSYVMLLEELSSNPKALATKINDPRIQNTLSVMLGIDLQMGNDEPMDTEPPKPDPKLSKPPQTKVPQKVPQNVQDSLKAKDNGNAAYKKKDFPSALTFYDQAFELDQTNMAILTNKAAVYFEQNEMDKCREVCLKAVDVGRENKAEYKLIAKAFARMGNSYWKEKDYENAKKYFNKSLTEDRNKDVLQKLHQCEKMMEEAKRLEYINPEISLQEKEKGNTAYKKGIYPEALKFYTEAIKRNPDNATLYSNRAACYMKLVEFHLALKDCELCIEKDPTFIKGHIRKGGALEAMKDYTKALEAYQKALEIDPNNNEASEGCKRCLHGDYQNRNNPEEVQKRAMNDPEVGRIMRDPAMKMILDQIQRDPKALQEHLQNPEVAKNIKKLLDVGILSVR